VLAFEIWKNGKKLAVAGLEHSGAVSFMLTWVGKGAGASSRAIEGAEIDGLDLRVGGIDSSESSGDQSVEWIEDTALRIGDDIQIRLVAADSADAPFRREPTKSLLSRLIARGEIVEAIVADDDDRENEGDLFVAAALCTPEKMAFIIRHCCGIVCAPLTLEDARRLHLAPMVALNDAPLGTAFTVSVDVRHGLTTGISAEERCNTVRALANGNMGAADFVRPGHVFPLVAKDGGVLMRSGHTEAASICAGSPAAAGRRALRTDANDDGTVMRGPQIAALRASGTS
jgi:3,4-dihydroxy-2-butanone 4-phosphate synthase